MLGLPILAAQPAAQGDLVLCSHTFYYIPPEEWLLHLERLVSWMSPTGVTIVVLQHRESGCMNMVHHFFGHRFELRRTADAFRAKHGDRYDVVTTLDPAHVETPDLDKAYAVAEFMLNLLDIKSAPTRQDVEAYVQANFATQHRKVPHSGASRFSPDSPPTTSWSGLKSGYARNKLLPSSQIGAKLVPKHPDTR